MGGKILSGVSLGSSDIRPLYLLQTLGLSRQGRDNRWGPDDSNLRASALENNKLHMDSHRSHSANAPRGTRLVLAKGQ